MSVTSEDELPTPSQSTVTHKPFPSAIIIRSAPYNPPHPSTYQLTPHNPLPPRHIAWHEWNINPAKHGPEHLTRIPTFVPASAQYDELGRSVGDGVGVEVDLGRVRRGLEDGVTVAEWYDRLARRDGGIHTPGAGPSRLPTPPFGISNMDDPIDFTNSPSPSPPPSPLPTKSEPPDTSTATKPPVKIKSSEWYIRRALLRQSPNTATHPPTKPQPIASLLNIPTQPRVRSAKYVIGPENAGYALLDRLGWEGGGLGRAPGWTPNQVIPTSVPEPVIPVTAEVIVSLDVNRNPIIDLISDSESEEDDFPLEAIRQGGPGRLMPIATALKLDRAGLGRRGMEKKVTHSAAEIARAQRRAKFGQTQGKGKGEVGEIGKKMKVRMKEKEKRERDERRRIQNALNG